MKYLGYKISGGLGHMLFQINNGIAMSKLSGRKLVIDTSTYTFQQDFNKYFTIPNFEYITHTSKNIPKSFDFYNRARFDPKINSYWLGNTSECISYDNLDFLPSDKEIVYYSYMKCSVNGVKLYDPNHFKIKILPEIINKLSKQKILEPYIGVHYRNTDIKHDINVIVNSIKTISSNGIRTVYLATDDIAGYDNIKKLLGKEYNLIQHTIPNHGEGNTVHMHNPNKKEVVENAITDIYNLSNASYFIPSPRSSFSKLVQTNICKI